MSRDRLPLPPQPHQLNAPQLHLLGRAASQVIVFFGRHELEPTIHLDYRPAFGLYIRVWLHHAPPEPILSKWWAQPWLQYFEVEEVSVRPPAFSFSLTPLYEH